MKNILLLLFLSFGYCYGQTYTYQPMNLDTSCFWVHQYYYWSNGGLTECYGERITIVEKDTLIGANLFYKLRTYTSDINISDPKIVCDNMHFKYDNIIYLREDTSIHKLLDSFGNIVIDFDKNIGDTMDVGLLSNNPIVDSITINSYNGVTRKAHWGQVGLLGPYATIEGIGANFNFPVREYGEWMNPVYTLKCYSKNGQIIYPDNPIDSCVRNPKVFVGIEDYSIKKVKYSIINRRFQILESSEYPIKFSLYDLTGKALYNAIIKKDEHIDVPEFITAGLYLLSLGNSKAIFNNLILIE